MQWCEKSVILLSIRPRIRAKRGETTAHRDRARSQYFGIDPMSRGGPKSRRIGPGGSTPLRVD